MLYAIKWPNIIVWLLLLPEILGNKYFVIICFSVHDVENFKIYLSFLIKQFFYVTKKSGQIFEYI